MNNSSPTVCQDRRRYRPMCLSRTHYINNPPGPEDPFDFNRVTSLHSLKLSLLWPATEPVRGHGGTAAQTAAPPPPPTGSQSSPPVLPVVVRYKVCKAG